MNGRLRGTLSLPRAQAGDWGFVGNKRPRSPPPPQSRGCQVTPPSPLSPSLLPVTGLPAPPNDTATGDKDLHGEAGHIPVPVEKDGERRQ